MEPGHGFRPSFRAVLNSAPLSGRPTMPLTEKQKRHLRGLGHKLRPVVMTGNAGLTPAVLAEITNALDSHELLKIRVRSDDRKARDQAIVTICENTGATLVQRIGHVALLYRPDPDKPSISLPKS